MFGIRSLSLLSILWAGLFISIPATGEQSADEGAAKIRASFAEKLPSIKIDSISQTPIAGLYEIAIGPRVIYMSGDGRYLLSGDITDMETGDNLTEPKIAAAKIKAIEEVGEDNMIVFGPKDAKHEINVFTDIDCGYCRKLHNEMAAYNEEGIRVRYLMYPRAGIGSESYDKAVSVWCADNQTAAMTAAKSGESVASKKCENPVEQHMMLGQMLGVTGTPSLVLSDGETIPGYVPPKRLIKLLEQQ